MAGVTVGNVSLDDVDFWRLIKYNLKVTKRLFHYVSEGFMNHFFEKVDKKLIVQAKIYRCEICLTGLTSVRLQDK